MSALAGRRILLVEDEAIIAAMVEDMLTQLGAHVVGPASSISAGLSLADTEVVDAAVLDVNIRSNRIDPIVDLMRTRHIPFVFATGYGASAAAVTGREPVIEKPYTMEKLESALALVLRAGHRSSP